MDALVTGLTGGVGEMVTGAMGAIGSIVPVAMPILGAFIIIGAIIAVVKKMSGSKNA